MLKAAQRPYIIAGGGVHYSEAWDELAAFADALGIPVGETHAGRGAIREGSAMALSQSGAGVSGTPGAAELASEADLVLCIGTRLHDFVTGSNTAFHDPDVRFICVNVNGRDAYKMGALPVIADAKLALQVLTAAASASGRDAERRVGGEGTSPREDWERASALSCTSTAPVSK